MPATASANSISLRSTKWVFDFGRLPKPKWIAELTIPDIEEPDHGEIQWEECGAGLMLPSYPYSVTECGIPPSLSKVEFSKKNNRPWGAYLDLTPKSGKIRILRGSDDHKLDGELLAEWTPDDPIMRLCVVVDRRRMLQKSLSIDFNDPEVMALNLINYKAPVKGRGPLQIKALAWKKESAAWLAETFLDLIRDGKDAAKWVSELDRKRADLDRLKNDDAMHKEEWTTNREHALKALCAAFGEKLLQTMEPPGRPEVAAAWTRMFHSKGQTPPARNSVKTVLEDLGFGWL